MPSNLDRDVTPAHPAPARRPAVPDGRRRRIGRRWQLGPRGSAAVLCAGVALGVGAAVVGFNHSHLWQRDFAAGDLIVQEDPAEPTSAHSGHAPLRGLSDLGVQIAFHSYAEYGDGSSRLWLHDTVDGATTLVSAGWASRYGITDPMNPMFWPGSADDSRWITFMAVADGEWNVFMANVDQPGGAPVNLTGAGASTAWERNEDPKFSADGERLYFTRDGDIVVGDLRWDHGTPHLADVRAIISTPQESAPDDDTYLGDDAGAPVGGTPVGGEESMPYPDPAGSTVYFTRGTHAAADLWAADADGTDERLVIEGVGTSDYYPVVAADGTLFFTRWASATDPHDTIWIQEPGDPAPHLLLARDGADVADPAPLAGPDLLVFSMTDGDSTPFRLHVLDVRTGEDAPLPLDGIPGNMLGAHLRMPAA